MAARPAPIDDADADALVSQQLYARHAAGYDASARRTMALRQRTVALLRLQPGETVLDVGAGTGLSYPLLVQAVGPQGRVLAFEHAQPMFERAAERVRAEGWRNVWQVCTTARRVRLPQPPDALLFNYVHDITRDEQAVAHLLAQAKPGARIAMAGMKFFPRWLAPLNLLAWAKNRPYNAHPGGLRAPWRVVQRHCERFEVRSTQCGMGYIAHGVLRG